MKITSALAMAFRTTSLLAPAADEMTMLVTEFAPKSIRYLL